MQTIDALTTQQVDALVPAVMPPDFQPHALDIEQEDAFVAEYPQIHLELIAQEMLRLLKTDRTERGKSAWRTCGLGLAAPETGQPGAVTTSD